ncbi:MAG: PaaI family thioesterase [Burkholderiales bacterium]|nr:PaaI family thioesterase [Burkholderiales bacterium]
MSVYRPACDAAYFNARSPGHLPGWMGVNILGIGQGFLEAELAVRRDLFAPNGFLHAGTVVTLADTACGYACVAHLPEGAKGFTTVELKSNHLGTALDGHIAVRAAAAHLGRTTQVWDATVTHRETGRTIALFRCTQMVLWPQ